MKFDLYLGHRSVHVTFSHLTQTRIVVKLKTVKNYVLDDNLSSQHICMKSPSSIYSQHVYIIDEICPGS